MTEIRVAEVMAALSLTTDLATGVPFEKGLRVCLVADELARRTGSSEAARAAVFQTTLLRSIGCTSHAPENAAEFVDDTAFQHALKLLDPGDADVFGAQLQRFGDWTGTPDRLAARFLEIAPTVGPYAASTGCEVSRALAPRLGACPAAVTALDDVYERWDGRGIPNGRSAAELAPETRILHLAEQAVLAQVSGGNAGAVAEVARRSGGHLDPDLVAEFLAHADAILAATDVPDTVEAVLEREPQPWVSVGPDRLVGLLAVLGTVADLKSTYLIGHSARLAGTAAAAAERLGLAQVEIDQVVGAAHLHNLGCVVVPSSLLDAARAPSTVERERLRLQGYWTSRILDRCPSLAGLEPLARPAGALHAAFAEGGHLTWERPTGGTAATDQPIGAALLEAAEAWCSLTEDRPGRPALPHAGAARALQEAAAAGLLEPTAVQAVLALPTEPAADATPLTVRELEVLRYASRGWSNKQIAAALFISERTVGHHLAHVYDKTGHRTRAGVAVWAAQRGLLPG